MTLGCLPSDGGPGLQGRFGRGRSRVRLPSTKLRFQAQSTTVSTLKAGPKYRCSTAVNIDKHILWYAGAIILLVLANTSILDKAAMQCKQYTYRARQVGSAHKHTNMHEPGICTYIAHVSSTNHRICINDWSPRDYIKARRVLCRNHDASASWVQGWV